MKTIEFFSGTKSFSKVAKELGHDTFTIDISQEFSPDLCADVLDLSLDNFPKDIDILWASPPCQSFSVATIGRNWTKGSIEPKTHSARLGLKLLEKTLEIIEVLKPRYWFIENPRGMMRKMKCLQSLHRKTVTYCQYGDSRMKPTDIWTNLVDWQPRPPCKNGAGCHVAAPRGSRTGTQGLKNAMERGVIPPDLFYEVFEYVNRVEIQGLQKIRK